ncbi:hypothetical protein EST38_g10498 [Candolleomyces aberdarensis]|uniref:Prolyl 4-hydroxylase alpha subunit Fe(2+) 2OG dioxygenase domain-containing protein n=1 Tax=Candolleomyces aberdarensis TaxID=2316362 RepID=A0A4Q2D9N4_9AGAR|nr:hypothetical protein EST38_g10498 [Candolleomyces aberdarensis]
MADTTNEPSKSNIHPQEVESNASEDDSDITVYGLEHAFSHLDHKGNFYHFSTDLEAPNPALSIEGVGTTRLPLSEQDAKLIISSNSGSSQPQKEHMDVDEDSTASMEVLEIGPAKIKFDNPEWEEFVKEVASTTVWEGLVGRPCASKSQCGLKKLLLYPAGSSSSPCTDKSGTETKTFVTMTFILPCPFEGGEVHVAHGGLERVISVSNDSKLSTSVSAWYQDVRHEVKPILSGYRLALVYEVIYTESRASLADRRTAQVALRKILRKWEYEESVLQAYMLSDNYDTSRFGDWSRALNYSDALKVSVLLPIAKALGFVVYLAKLEFTECGEGDWISGCEPDSGDTGSSAESKLMPQHKIDVLEMRGFEEMVPSITEFVRISDGRQLALGELDIHGHDQCVVAQEVFLSDMSLARTMFEGDSVPGPMSYVYEQSAIVLYPEAQEVPLLISYKGALWAIREDGFLSNVPIEEAKQIASKGIEELRRVREAELQSDVRALANYCTSLNDVSLWNQTFAYCSTDTVGDAVDRALGVFTLPSIEPGIKSLIEDTPMLKTLEFIQIISTHVGTSAEPGWVSRMTAEAFSSYSRGAVEDVPILISLSQKFGLRPIQEIMPRISDSWDFTGQFFAELARALHQNRAHFLTSPESPKDAEEACKAPSIEGVISKALLLAAQNTTKIGVDVKLIEWVCDMVDLCFVIGDLQPCTMLLRLVLQTASQLPIKQRLEKVYNPLTPPLKGVLRKYGCGLSLQPFRSFFKAVISSYLERVLGGSSYTPSFARRIICTSIKCTDCGGFEKWLNDPKSIGQYTLKAAEPRRIHLEEGITSCAMDLLAYNTLRNTTPCTLVATKRPEVVARFSWEGRQTAATEWLKSIGEDREWEVIMGERYGDFLKAIQGTKKFVGSVVQIEEADIIEPSVLMNAPLDIAISTSSPPDLVQVPTVAGMKRKRVYSDLT